MHTDPVQFAPTAEQWRAIEQISEALAETADLPTALETGVKMVLSALSREGAALYLPRFCEHVFHDWTFVNISAAWEYDLQAADQPLRLAMDAVYQSGVTAAGDPVLETAAIFPLSSAMKPLGALVVRGTTILPEEYALWQTFLRPITRLVMLHAKASGSFDGTPSYLDLIKSRNTLRAMFDSLPISIYIIDKNYRLVAVNNSRAARVGALPRNLVGGKCYEQLFHRSSPCEACRVIETFASGQSTSRVRSDGSETEKFTEYEISTFPIHDDRDQAVQVILVEIDVTEKRNLEANLVQAEKLAAVGQLAAGVAHEINNPLTAIIANAQLLRREIPPENEDVLDSIKLIETAGTRASQVVRNLLGIARKEKYELAPTDLNDTLHNALSLVQHELVGRPIQVYLSLDDQIPRVYASQDQLQGVWINLILNAIDALDKEPGEITIDSRYTGTEFQVVIQDNGKGIDPDHRSRVFEPFFTTKSPGRGTGLGLSVCMRVIRYHGGTIHVDSEAGKWTRFTVILPGQKDQPEPSV